MFYLIERRNYRLAILLMGLSMCFMTAIAAAALPSGEWWLIQLAGALAVPFMVIAFFGGLSARKRLVREAMKEIERGAMMVLRDGDMPQAIVINHRDRWYKLEPEAVIVLSLMPWILWKRAARIAVHNPEIGTKELFMKSFIW